MQCKDIPTQPVLQFLSGLSGGATWFDCRPEHPLFDNSVLWAMPEGTVAKLARAKMAGLIRQGLVEGCACGCRGNFVLTEKGRQTL